LADFHFQVVKHPEYPPDFGPFGVLNLS
jgi:hypothetical protein